MFSQINTRRRPPLGSAAVGNVAPFSLPKVVLPMKSANWIIPPDCGPGNTCTPTINNIVMFPFLADQNYTVTSLAAMVSTQQAASNCQLAIYAGDPTVNNLPNNAPLSSTGNIATTSQAAVSGALGAPVQVVKGQVYWLALNSDTASLIFMALNSAGCHVGRLIGDATLSNLFGNQVVYAGLKIAQTFGTWPTFTSASSFTRQNNSGVCAIALKVQ